MNNSQLYLAMGLPAILFAVLVNIVMGVIRHKAVIARFEDRFTAMEARIDTR